MSTFLPMEIFTVTEQEETVAISELTDIPSEVQIRQAISSLYKKKEECPDKYTYVKFPFGSMDYDGLQKLQMYHNYVQGKHMMSEEKTWLKQSEKACEDLGINIDNIYQYFQRHVWSGDSKSSSASIRNLVGQRWLSDYEIDDIFRIINQIHDHTIGFVCKPTRIMYSAGGLGEKIERILKKGTKPSRILMALNVGKNADGTCYVSDSKRDGIHWALLAIDLSNCKAYYGDSLEWSLPTNIADIVVPNLQKIENDLGIDITFLLKDVMTIENAGGSFCFNSCERFYPKQSCSNVCGVVVACMVGVLCDK